MSIKDLRNGRYLIDFTDSTNKRHRVKVRGSKKEVQLKETILRKKWEDEIMFPERRLQNITFRQIADNYFKLHGAQLRSSTWKYMSARILERFGNYTMKQLTSRILQEYYNELLSKELTPATAKRYLTLIGAMINMAEKHDLFNGKNPCKAVSIQPEDNQRTRYLSLAEIQILKTHCRVDVWSIVFCALCTGMRRGEILSLDWENVDLANDNITLLKTKSGKKREIPILPDLKTMLLQLNPQPQGKVFQITEDAFNCSFKRTLAKVQIPDFHFHDLRHTFASYFMMRGGLITDLQLILGHSSLKMTQRYAHLSPEHLKKGMRVMVGAFGSFQQEDPQPMQTTGPVSCGSCN